MLKTIRLPALGAILACGTANARKLRATIPADEAFHPLKKGNRPLVSS